MEHDSKCERVRVMKRLREEGWRDDQILRRLWGQSVRESVSCFCSERWHQTDYPASIESLVTATRTKGRFWASERKIEGPQAVQLVAEKRGIKLGDDVDENVIFVDFRNRKRVKRGHWV